MIKNQGRKINKLNKETKMASANIWQSTMLEAKETIEKFLASEELLKNCDAFGAALIDSYKAKGNVFSCGNGGSHCDAMHFAEELTGRYRDNRKPMGALALGDPSHVTCVSNDYGFDHIFSRQLEALGRKGDCLVALSTSGNSPNVIKAVESAKKIGIKTIGLLGKNGGKLKDMVDIPIVVPANTSDRVQEIHIKLIHTVIEVVERHFFPENY